MAASPSRGQSDAAPDHKPSELEHALSSSVYQATTLEVGDEKPRVYYARALLAMAQLFALNVCSSFAWIDLAPVVNFAAEHFDTSVPSINWFSTSFLLVAITAGYPASLAARHGPKTSMLVCSALLVVGTWIMYGGTRIGSFGLALFGHSVIAMAQPFTIILPAPFSEVWFPEGSRATSTAISGWASILGTVIGQFAFPAWITSVDSVTTGILYQSIMLSVTAFLTIFVPSRPPTPPGIHSEHAQSIIKLSEIKIIYSRPEVWLLVIPFGFIVGAFNALSFLIFQICVPYGFTINQCSIAGLLLSLPGLILSLVLGRVADMFKIHVILLKCMAVFTTAGCIAFIWIPSSGSPALLFAMSTVLGLGVVGPGAVSVEFIAEFLYPLGPELAISTAWALSNLLGGVLTVVCGSMTDKNGGIQPGLYLLIALALSVVPLTLSLGLFGRRDRVRLRRTEAEELIRNGMNTS